MPPPSPPNILLWTHGKCVPSLLTCSCKPSWTPSFNWPFSTPQRFINFHAKYFIFLSISCIVRSLPLILILRGSRVFLLSVANWRIPALHTRVRDFFDSDLIYRDKWWKVQFWMWANISSNNWICYVVCLIISLCNFGVVICCLTFTIFISGSGCDLLHQSDFLFSLSIRIYLIEWKRIIEIFFFIELKLGGILFLPDSLFRSNSLWMLKGMRVPRPFLFKIIGAGLNWTLVVLVFPVVKCLLVDFAE